MSKGNLMRLILLSTVLSFAVTFSTNTIVIAQNWSFTFKSEPGRDVDDTPHHDLDVVGIDFSEDFNEQLDKIIPQSYRCWTTIVVQLNANRTIKNAFWTKRIWSGDRTGRDAGIPGVKLEQSWALTKEFVHSTEQGLFASAALIWTDHLQEKSAIATVVVTGEMKSDGKLHGQFTISTPLELPYAIAAKLVPPVFEARDTRFNPLPPFSKELKKEEHRPQ